MHTGILPAARPHVDQVLEMLRTLDLLPADQIARVLQALEDARTRLWIRMQTSNPNAPRPAAVPGVELLTVREVATELRFSTGHTYELIRSGSLRAIRSGRTIRIPREALNEWLAAHDADGLDASGHRSAQSLRHDDLHARDERHRRDARRPGRKDQAPVRRRD